MFAWDRREGLASMRCACLRMESFRCKALTGHSHKPLEFFWIYLNPKQRDEISWQKGMQNQILRPTFLCPSFFTSSLPHAQKVWAFLYSTPKCWASYLYTSKVLGVSIFHARGEKAVLSISFVHDSESRVGLELRNDHGWIACWTSWRR